MTLRTSYKKILGNRISLITMSVSFLIYLAFLIRDCIFLNTQLAIEIQGVLTPLTHSDTTVKYVFVFFLFFTYEVCQGIVNSKATETLLCYRNATAKLYGGFFTVLSALAGALSTVYFIVNSIGYFYIVKKYEYPFMAKIELFYLKSTLVYFLLPCICAICFGILFSAIFKRVAAYVMMLITVLLSIAIEVVDELPTISEVENGKYLFKIIEIFSIFPQDIQRVPSTWFGRNVAIDRTENVILLICLSVFLFLVIVQKKEHDFKNTALKCTSLVLCVLMCAVYFTPKSRYIPIQDHSESSYNAEIQNFGNSASKEADFTVNSYEMIFDIKSSLKAEVKVNFDAQPEKEMDFTLWHLYEIKNITDKNGNKVDFNRNGNYVTVKSPEGNTSLTFNYKGYSYRFVSNRSYTFLPGYFAYYPIAGKKQVQNQFAMGPAFKDMSNDYKVDFDVTVNASKSFISTLDKTEKNKFSGTAYSVGLFCSDLIDEIEINSVKVIYPITTYFTQFRSYQTPEELAKSESYSEFSKIVDAMKNAGLVSDGGCIVYQPFLYQQHGERDFVAHDTVYSIYLKVLYEFTQEEIESRYNVNVQEWFSYD